MIELNTVYNEPCLETLKRMEDNSIDCVITSPPYWQLRDYGYDGQWGMEPTYQQYLEHLWSMMDEAYRVLKPSGTAWINLGDTYSTVSGSNLALHRGDTRSYDSEYLTNMGRTALALKDNSLPGKCLLLIPHRFAIGCMDRGWIIRNDIIWAKRNGMPESVSDRFSKKHEYFFFMVKSEKYFFNLDSVREKQSDISLRRYEYMFTGTEGGNGKNMQGVKMRDRSKEVYAASALLSPVGKGSRPEIHENGKNPGSVSDFWNINTKPSKKGHYASYNDDLIKRPILAGCPKGGIIYDPFTGTGTTGVMAINNGMNFIGSEMSPEYFKDAAQRIDGANRQMKMF